MTLLRRFQCPADMRRRVTRRNSAGRPGPKVLRTVPPRPRASAGHERAGVPMPSTWIPRKPARAYVRPGTSSRTGHAHVTVSGRCSWRRTKKLSAQRGALSGSRCELARPLQQRGQHGPGFDAGKRGAHAVVDAVPEGQVTTRRPASEVHDVGVIELCGIPVRRSKQQHRR